MTDDEAGDVTDDRAGEATGDATGEATGGVSGEGLPKCPAGTDARAASAGACRHFGAELIGFTQPISEGHGAMRITEIQQQVGRGQYRVDTQAVADAIVRRLLAQRQTAATPPRAQGPYRACS
ncbi:MAG: flagellar biosynthesis anti-sigma factor FlgM [Solirubrobacteraceae bacterium]